MDQDDADRRHREAEKSAAIADIAVVLNSAEQERRNPDLWERVHLVHALAAVFSGCYSLASTEARLALTPPNQRSPGAVLPTDAIYDRCDLALLWRAMQEAMAEPVRRFPHFGRVEIV